MKRSQKRLVGAVFWLVSATCGLVFVAKASRTSDDPEAESPKTIQTVVRYVTGQELRIEQRDPAMMLRVGDPVFLDDGEGGFRQVGAVGRVGLSGESSADRTTDSGIESESGEGRRIEIVWYERSISPEECQLFQYHSTGRLSEVVETLLPPEKQERIRERLALAMNQHGSDLSAAFVPLVEESLKESLPIIEVGFQEAIARHRPEIDAAAERWNEQLVEKRLIPLARREILPIVKKHGQPPAEEIGREIWDRASLFRFGWRAIYDKSPLPQRDLLQEEWKRFVEDEAVPVLQEHMDEIVVAIQRSVQDVSANPAVRRELARVAEQVASDPESRQLIQTVLKEAVVDNQELRDLWRDIWSSEQARAAFELTGDRLEPTVRQIGDEIFGSEADGINPDFARVLRSQILRKDRRWVVAWHTGAGNGIVEVAYNPMPYPVVYVAQEN